MKISQLPPTANPAAPAHGLRGTRPNTDSGSSAPVAPDAGVGVSAPASVAAQSRPEAPRGLEKVLERLQTSTERNGGQSTALERIERNLARYAEMRAMEPPPPPPPADGPAPDSELMPPDAIVVPPVGLSPADPGADVAEPPAAA